MDDKEKIAFKDEARTLMNELTQLLSKLIKELKSIGNFPGCSILMKLYTNEIVLEEHREELDKHEADIDRFFKTLTQYKYITFYYLEVLDIIIESCKEQREDCEDKFCGKELEIYKKKLENHLKTRICEHQKFHQHSIKQSVSSVETEDLIIFTDDLWGKELPYSKLYYLRRVLEAALKCNNIHLQAMYMGCLVLHFHKPFPRSLIPSFEADEQMLLKLINVGVSAMEERTNSCQIREVCK